MKKKPIRQSLHVIRGGSHVVRGVQKNATSDFIKVNPIQWQEGDLDYDSEPERTLLRRKREARRRARQAALEQQLNMVAEHHDDNLNLENNQNRVTLGQYINPTADSCCSTIQRPAIQANNFELKPSLI
ncbi:hypothetical protein PIB30_031246 [Stylosanthes scabra]|uniref:Uncharacterized protein n=1 Tax=Stylosanthes scabra TaxID=79078 RepID=A0ABU6VDX0_9FABA|nr:hypothetical protein [Stylosanthes scabra]